MGYCVEGFGVDRGWYMSIRKFDGDCHFETFEEAKQNALDYYKEMIADYQREHDLLAACETFEQYDEDDYYEEED